MAAGEDARAPQSIGMVARFRSGASVGATPTAALATAALPNKSLMLGEATANSRSLISPTPLQSTRSMTIQVAVLCDAATDYNGKLNLLGTFDTICAPQMPTQHAQCSIAIRIAFDRIEEGTHTLNLNFVDEDGLPIMKSMQIPVEVAFPTDATFISRNLVVNILQLTFSKAGLYSVDLSLDNRPLSSIPLAVKQLELKPA
jgi:hypothetical protein